MDRTATTDVWPTVHAGRAALAADLAGLTDARWGTPSLCTGWTVRDVLAHLTAAASLGPGRWMWSVLRRRFDFDRHNADRLAEQLGATPGETLDRFRAVVTSRTSTFGPTDAWLGEVVVHAEDIRRPLGIRHAHPVDVLTRVARFYATTDFTVPGTDPRAAAGRHRRPVRPRRRTPGVGQHPGADHGDGRTPRVLRRTHRRRRPGPACTDGPLKSGC